MRNCLFQAISPFLTMFSTAIYLLCVKMRHFVVMSSPFTPQILILTHQQQTAFENIVGKEEIAHNKQFLLFPRFRLNQKIVSSFVNIFDISLLAAELDEPKIGI